MALGARIRAMSRGQVAANATPPSGSAAENVWTQYYDTQTYPAAGIRSLDFFLATNADRTLSNMKTPGQLPSPESLRLYNVCLDAWPADTSVSTSAGVAGNLDDLQDILFRARPTWTIKIADKSYGPYSASALRGTGGPIGFGFSSDGVEILQWARVDSSAGWTYEGQLTIPETVPFSVTLNFQNTLIAVAQDWLLRVSLFGGGIRRVS